MSEPTEAKDVCEEPDCMQTLRDLDVFLDDEISSQTRESIRRHLDGCPDCEHAFDFHAVLKSIIQRKCLDEEIPADLLMRIKKCFDTESNDASPADPGLPIRGHGQPESR